MHEWRWLKEKGLAFVVRALLFLEAFTYFFFRFISLSTSTATSRWKIPLAADPIRT